jgi:succinyl-diaminopimelate desuccinylase
MTPAAYIDLNANGLLSRLQTLIGISTVNPPGENYDKITAGLTRNLTALGLKTKR